MSRHPLRWLPPFVLGVCAATAGEVAVGLLLYSGPGMMRSLTTILAVEAGSLGIGVMTAPGPRPDIVEALRRRWLFCLAAFLGATIFTGLWSVVQSLGGTALGQGLGLAVAAGLPLYAVGGTVGAMATVAASDPDDRLGSVGGPAILGGALGFAATGASLPQVFTPASILLVCLVLLSAGGLVYGSVLDRRSRVHVRARRPSPVGDVRVEDRHHPASDAAVRILREGEFIRTWISLAVDARTSWELAARDLRPAGSAAPERVLCLGGGASTSPASLLRELPAVRVDVAERNAAVLELGREHLETALDEREDGRLAVLMGNWEDALGRLEGPYDLVVLDTAAWTPVGGAASLSGDGRRAVFGRVAPAGILVLGPAPLTPGTWAFPLDWSVATYRRGVPESFALLGAGLPSEEVLAAASPDPGAVWPLEAGGFTRVESPTP